MRESDKYNTSNMQDSLLSMMKAVHTFFEENHIQYSLNGGTLLGAIRENGFIPWDDDIDIMVDRDNYKKICENFKKFDGYLLKREDWIYRIVKKDSLGNTTIPQIDIFIVDNVPNSKFVSAIKTFIIKVLQGMMKRHPDYSKVSDFYKVCLYITKTMGLLFSNDRIYNWYNRVSQYGQARATKKVSLYNNIYRFVGIYLDSNMMKNLELHKFEDTELYITKYYEEYLTKHYGDYMTPVKETERIPTHM